MIWTTLPGGVSDVDLLVNDLSVHGQFPDISSFRESVSRIMALRRVARDFGREVYLYRNFVHSRRINADTSVHQALQRLPRDEKRAILSWFDRQGPYWDDDARHSPDHYLECGGEVVTETGIGEAAYCAMSGISRGLASLTPSDWEHSPVAVRLIADPAAHVCIPNYWYPPELEASLQNAQPPIASWSELEAVARERFRQLTFSADCFRPLLDGQPFQPGQNGRNYQPTGSAEPVGQSGGCPRAPDGRRAFTVSEAFHWRQRLVFRFLRPRKEQFREPTDVPTPGGTRAFFVLHMAWQSRQNQ